MAEVLLAQHLLRLIQLVSFPCLFAPSWIAKTSTCSASIHGGSNLFVTKDPALQWGLGSSNHIG